MTPRAPLTAGDRAALQAVASGARTREQLAAVIGAGPMASKGAVTRLRARGLISDEGERPPVLRLSSEGEAVLGRDVVA